MNPNTVTTTKFALLLLTAATFLPALAIGAATTEEYARTYNAMVANFKPPSKNIAMATPGEYKNDALHTKVLWSVSHLGFSTYMGEFIKSSGTLKLDPKNLPASSLEMTVQADSLSTGSQQANGNIGNFWIEAPKYPTITFKSRKVSPLDSSGKFNVEGDLTLHGVTKPVTFVATFNGAGPSVPASVYSVGFDATAKIKRSDFGITVMIPAIGDEVTLNIGATFNKTAN